MTLAVNRFTRTRLAAFQPSHDRSTETSSVVDAVASSFEGVNGYELQPHSEKYSRPRLIRHGAGRTDEMSGLIFRRPANYYRVRRREFFL